MIIRKPSLKRFKINDTRDILRKESFFYYTVIRNTISVVILKDVIVTASYFDVDSLE